MDAGFSAMQVSRLARVPYRTLARWDEIGLVKPSIAAARGTGTERRYDIADVIMARVVGELRRQNIPLQSIRKAVDRLREQGFDRPLAELTLVAVAGDVVACRGDEVWSVLRAPNQSIFRWVLDVGRIVAEIHAKLAA